MLDFEASAKMVQGVECNARYVGIGYADFHHAEFILQSRETLSAGFECNKRLLVRARNGAMQTMLQSGKPGLEQGMPISCGPSTFALDRTVLLDQNDQLAKISIMDRFPQTAHTKLMALFVRQL